MKTNVLRARSSGEVKTPYAYNFRTSLPEAGGLYCIDVFGPVPWRAGEMMMATDERKDRWGHVALPEALAFKSGSAAEVLMIVPPVYRRFKVLSADEHRSHARARRAELVELADTDAWPYPCDTLDKLLREEGLDDPRAIEALGEGAIEPRLNVAYRAVINHCQRLEKLVEYGAPEATLEEYRAMLMASFARTEDELNAASLPTAVRALALGGGRDEEGEPMAERNHGQAS